MTDCMKYALGSFKSVELSISDMTQQNLIGNIFLLDE